MARNAGARKARGEALVFCDADQTVEPAYLRNILKDWQDAGYGAFGSICRFLPNSHKVPRENQSVKEEMFLQGFKMNGTVYSRLGGGNAVYRREVFEALGGFDESLFSSEDMDLVLRMQKDLKLKVKYNFGAVAYHRTRDWRSLLRREYRVGFGEGLFRQKYPGTRKVIVLTALSLLKRNSLGLIALVLVPVRPLGLDAKKEKILTILLDVAVQWVNFLGMIQAYVTHKRRIIPANW